MSAHTPGPWVAEINAIAAHVWSKADGYPFEVAGLIIPVWAATHPDPATRSRIAADARLIAAAPELLALLKTANDGVTGSHTVAWQDACRAAIAKATQPTAALAATEGEKQHG